MRTAKNRGVAQVVERFVRDEEAASSSLVTPIIFLPKNQRVPAVFGLFNFHRLKCVNALFCAVGKYAADKICHEFVMNLS